MGKQIKITVECNGEKVETTVDSDETVQTLFDKGHLRGITTSAGIRVNGSPATRETPIPPNATVQTVPQSGRLGLIVGQQGTGSNPGR